ncbi:MAG: insulinase family protein [Opitutaceae bacterium]
MRVLPLFPWPCLVILLLLLRAPLFAGAAPRWAHESSQIEPDARVVWGKLENGLRYAILPNGDPKGRVYLQLYVAAGSIQERDDERGLAHFVEHMAFKGTTHFRKNDLIEYTQRHGMSFGGDTNAGTTYDHTLYRLALTDNAPAEWKAGLLILRDWAGGVTFDPAEFETERGVIESERRLRDDASTRVFDQKLERWVAGTAFAARSPIGASSVILHAPLEKLRAFYDAWYRPERMVVLVVGDIEPTAIESSLREMFSDLAGRGAPREEKPLGRPSAQGTIGLPLGDPELPAATFSTIESVSLREPGPDTVERRREELRRQFGFAMFQRRLAKFAANQSYYFSHPTAELNQGIFPLQIAGLGAGGPTWRWKKNIGILEQQLRAALQFGFTSAELGMVKESYLNGVEHTAARWRELPSESLIGSLFSSIREQRVFSDPVERLAPTREFLQEVTPEDCTAAFREVWKSSDRLVGTMGRGLTFPKGPAIVAAYEASQRTPVRQSREAGAPVFAYSDFGPPGKIEKQDLDPALDFFRVTFANGIRLNIKRTAFRKNEVYINVRFAGGVLAQSERNPGQLSYVGAWALGGLLKHPPAEVADFNAAHLVRLSFSADRENFAQSISVRPQDLRYALELATAYFSEPAFGKNEWRRLWSEQLGRRSDMLRSLDGTSQLRISPILASGDKRLEVPGLIGSFLARRSSFIQWFRPILETSPMEIAVVGDADPLEVIREVARTFGTLPARRRERSELDGAPLVAEEQAVEKTLTYPSNSGRALNTLAWRQTRGGEYPERQKMVVLASILEDRVYKKIRGEMGFTYSPSVSLELFEHSPDYAFLICMVETIPGRTAEVQLAIQEIAQSLAGRGVTEEEFERARAPLLAGQMSEVRTNDYWLDLLDQAQSNPKRFQWWKERTEKLKALTKADLDAAAQNYFRADRLSAFVIRPKN